MNKYIAELMGTLALVFFGCGSAVIAGGDVGFLGISFAFGIALLMMVYTIGPISGCHVNPAVTIAMVVGGRMNPANAIGYIIAQCIGAVLGALLLYLIAKTLPGWDGGLGQNGFDAGSPKGYGLTAAIIAEIVLTALFIYVIFGATSAGAPAGFAGIAIGLALVVVHIVGIPVTGTSVNPARSFGPALFVGGEAFSQLWVFIVAPIIGGIIGAILWRITSSD